MVPKSQEWWQGIWNINFFRQSLKITSDILRYIRYSALQCHLAAAFCFIINVAWFIFSDLSSDARTFSCLYFKRYIIYGQNSQSQVFQQNNLLKSCIGSLVKSENCNRTASPLDLAHCAPLRSALTVKYMLFFDKSPKQPFLSLKFLRKKCFWSPFSRRPKNSLLDTSPDCLLRRCSPCVLSSK